MSIALALSGPHSADVTTSHITTGRKVADMQLGVTSTEYRAIHTNALWRGIKQMLDEQSILKLLIEQAYHAAEQGELADAAYGLSTSVLFKCSLTIDQRDAVFAKVTVLYIESLSRNDRRTPDGKTAMEYLQLHSCFLTSQEYKNALSSIHLYIEPADAYV